MKTIIVKEWLIQKNYSNNELYAIHEINNEFTITLETEKAYKGYYDTNYGKIYAWCPKSCIVGNDFAERENKISEEEQIRLELLKECKENDLDVEDDYDISSLNMALSLFKKFGFKGE